MKIVVSVASRDQNRLNGFLENLSQCRFTNNAQAMVLITGGDVRIDRKGWKAFIASKTISDVKRHYAAVIYEKFQMVKAIMQEDDIWIATDDDYQWNPHVMPFVERVMGDNPNVDYLCLLRGPGVTNIEQVALCGVPFFRHSSMMGGSVIARWKNFMPMMDGFFEEYGLEGMWDTDYWAYLQRKTGETHHIYTLVYFSLMQQCNLGSHYQKSMGEHMYAENFDGRMNPFDWIRRAGL